MCVYLVYPDTKCLQEVTFYVASNDGSILLSYVTTVTLGLIQPCTRLDYLPPRASLITISADHPKKTKSQISVHVSQKNLKCPLCPTTKVWYPSLLQARNRFLQIIQMCLMVLDAFLVPHTISKSILLSHPSKSLADQSQCILRSLSRKK